MIVDFCCGANDFSCFMKQKLDETGKKCLFKNYDIIQSKNDFGFVKKDWMTVQRSDLSKCSELIIGLNPPFGVKAALANKFIDKALQFKPKLVILIVPEETERLDKKKQPEYDLIWEDRKSLSGKSFYLPGSFDAKDKQMEQWNVNPPVLNLWSHKAWSQRHRTIAQQQGHTSRDQKEPYPAYEDQAQEAKESHKHQISQLDHNMGDKSGSSKQKKRRRERSMRAKMAKKMRVAQRSGGSGRGPLSQEMHKHNSFAGPSNPVQVDFTEDPYSCDLNRHNCFGFDASSISSLRDLRMGVMPVAQCYAPPQLEMNFGMSRR